MKHLCQLVGCRLWSAVKAFLIEHADLSTLTQSKSAQCASNRRTELRPAGRVRVEGKEGEREIKQKGEREETRKRESKTKNNAPTWSDGVMMEGGENGLKGC